MISIPEETLATIARAQGLHLAGVASPEPLEDGARSLAAWQERGYAGELRYMLRPPSLLSDPRVLHPATRSILLFAVHYDRRPHPARAPGFGRVARYAWGEDYHRVFKVRLRALMSALERELARPISFRIFSDAVPLLERALATRAGLGFVGRNTLLIRRREGSFFFIAEVLTDLAVQPSFQTPETGECGTCTRCLSKCPTGALTEPYQLDARRCISYLTIEKRGVLSSWEREAIGEWIFGCDECQECCPFNHSVLRAQAAPSLPEFGYEKGAGPLVDLGSLFAVPSQRAFARRFAGTPLLRAGREGLLRNAAVVAANTDAVMLLPLLEEAASADRSPVVRSHALAAFFSLAKKDTLGPPRVDVVMNRARLDPDPRVAAEAEELLGGEQ